MTLPFAPGFLGRCGLDVLATIFYRGCSGVVAFGLPKNWVGFNLPRPPPLARRSARGKSGMSPTPCPLGIMERGSPQATQKLIGLAATPPLASGSPGCAGGPLGSGARLTAEIVAGYLADRPYSGLGTNPPDATGAPGRRARCFHVAMPARSCGGGLALRLPCCGPSGKDFAPQPRFREACGVGCSDRCACLEAWRRGRHQEAQLRAVCGRPYHPSPGSACFSGMGC